MEVKIAESALADLQAIKQYYLELDVPHVGLDYVTAVFNRLELLKRHPDSGRVVPEFNQISIREVILPPFRVVYLHENDVLTLIRVWRSERLLHL